MKNNLKALNCNVLQIKKKAHAKYTYKLLNKISQGYLHSYEGILETSETV